MPKSEPWQTRWSSRVDLVHKTPKPQNPKTPKPQNPAQLNNNNQMEDRPSSVSPKKETFTSHMRPKTAVTAADAVGYDAVDDDDPDFSPETDIFFTEEVKIDKIDGVKVINEFKILDWIGEGSYSKVNKVIRMFWEGEESHEKVYAMKIIHKPTLKKERTAIYYPGGDFEMSDAHEKVIMEIDNWS